MPIATGVLIGRVHAKKEREKEKPPSVGFTMSRSSDVNVNAAFERSGWAERSF